MTSGPTQVGLPPWDVLLNIEGGTNGPQLRQFDSVQPPRPCLPTQSYCTGRVWKGAQTRARLRPHRTNLGWQVS